jgi:hypothetical protein
VLASPDFACECGRAVDPVDDDTVQVIEDGLEVGVELAELGGCELAIEYAALDPVEIAAAAAQSLRVVLDGRVVDEDDLHGLPPRSEGLVRLAFEAEPYELQRLQAD